MDRHHGRRVVVLVRVNYSCRFSRGGSRRWFNGHPARCRVVQLRGVTSKSDQVIGPATIYNQAISSRRAFFIGTEWKADPRRSWHPTGVRRTCIVWHFPFWTFRLLESLLETREQRVAMVCLRVGNSDAIRMLERPGFDGDFQHTYHCGADLQYRPTFARSGRRNSSLLETRSNHGRWKHG